MKKIQEPEVEANHEDFLIDEMENMAIDFQEENLFKRCLATKCAREAQQFLFNKEKAKLRKEYDVLAEERKLEEEKKVEEMIAPIQIDEFLIPDNQSLQIKVTFSGLFRNDSMNNPMR